MPLHLKIKLGLVRTMGFESMDLTKLEIALLAKKLPKIGGANVNVNYWTEPNLLPENKWPNPALNSALIYFHKLFSPTSSPLFLVVGKTVVFTVQNMGS